MALERIYFSFSIAQKALYFHVKGGEKRKHLGTFFVTFAKLFFIVALIFPRKKYMMDILQGKEGNVVTNKQTDVSLTQGSLLPKIVRFTIPVMITGMLQLFYNAADIIVVGRWAGTVAQSAVGSTTSVVNLMVNLFIGLSVGVSVVLSTQLGAKDEKAVRQTVHTAMAVALVLGIGSMLLGLVASPAFLVWMKTPDNVIEQSILYIRILFLGMPCNMVANFGFAIIRSTGDAKRPLKYLAISGLINVLLNLTLVAVFHFDVAGVAIATITAQTLCAIWAVRHLMGRDDALRFTPGAWSVSAQKVKQIVRIGLPAGLQSMMFSISNVVVQSTVNSFGDVAMAADANAATIVSFLFLGVNAVQQSATVFTSQNMGASEYGRVRRTLRYSVILTVSIAVVTSTAFNVFAVPVLSLYNTDPEVIALGVMKLQVVTPVYFIFALTDTLGGFLRGLGYSLTPMLMSLCGICILRVAWIFIVFPLEPTLRCLYLSYPVTWSATLVGLVLAVIWRLRQLPKS